MNWPTWLTAWKVALFVGMFLFVALEFVAIWWMERLRGERLKVLRQLRIERETSRLVELAELRCDTRAAELHRWRRQVEQQVWLQQGIEQ